MQRRLWWIGMAIAAAVVYYATSVLFLTDEQRQRMKVVHDRIKQYGSGSMSKRHPGGYKHQGKDKDKES